MKQASRPGAALATGSWIAANAADIIYFASLLILSYGCWLAWMPLGFIVFGGMVCLPMLAARVMVVRKKEG